MGSDVSLSQCVSLLRNMWRYWKTAKELAQLSNCCTETTSMAQHSTRAQIIIDAIMKLLEVSANLKQGAGLSKNQIPSNSSNDPPPIIPGTPPPAYSEMPPPDAPPISTNIEPSVICRVCQQHICIKGKEHQLVVKCANCQEATPIKAPPDGKKYICCPCNALLTCKVSSNIVYCPRVHCKRTINNTALPMVLPAVTCIHYNKIFVEMGTNGEGTKFQCKLVGITDVACPEGGDECAEAFRKLKAQAKTKLQHEERVALTVSLEGIRIEDEISQKVQHLHPVKRISFVTPDPDDQKVFGIVCSQPDCSTGYKFYALESENAQIIIDAIMKLLEVSANLKQGAGLSKNQIPSNSSNESQTELQGMRARLSNLQQQLREKDDQLLDVRGQLQEQELLKTNMQEQLEGKEQQLVEMELRLREMNQQLSDLQVQIREKDRATVALQERLGISVQQVGELEEQLTRKDREKNELERSLSTAQQTLRDNQVQRSPDWVIARNQIQLTSKTLGRGAWGEVAQGKFCGCVVAVKTIYDVIISPHNRRLFEREMDIASRCRHPCLLQFIGATNDDYTPLFLTELMETSLRALLEERSLSQTEITVIALDVARGLNYLHQKHPIPILHRDISSANVLLWRQGTQWRAKVSDYGTANFKKQIMTVAPGAPIYSAPEARATNQTVKVDVYSFGVLLCEMSIRELPDPERKEQQVVMVTNSVLRALIRRCLETDPQARPSMEEIIDEIELEAQGTV